MEQEQKVKFTIADFAKRISARKGKRAPTDRLAYNGWYHSVGGSHVQFDLDNIKEIIESGDLDAKMGLSQYYYASNGIYKNAVNLMANLPLYQTVVTPLFLPDKAIDKNKLMRAFYSACDYVEALAVPVAFAEISRLALLNGIYYGIMREIDHKYVIQELPAEYCRTRFKDINGLNIIEFNTNYFDTISDKRMRDEALNSYPAHIRKAYHSKTLNDDYGWVEIYPEDGGACFFYGDKSPIFISSIPNIYKLNDAVDREARRDENELYKLLIQKMPIQNGELVFELEEMAEYHASVADMLADNDTIDVLTTVGDASLESIQDSTAASQSADRIDKYKNNTFDNLGISSLYFNANTSASMPYMIAKDEAFMALLTNQYSLWIKYQINRLFARPNVTFDFTILPTTRYNRKEIQSQLFQGAQYGYSKIYAGVALGIPQKDIISLMDFENTYLGMTEKMIPLMSSYTSSNNDIQAKKNNGGAEQNITKTANPQDISNEGGRPELDLQDKSEKTLQNIEAK